MQNFVAIMGITTTLLLGAASPGPSFIMVARTAASTSRRNGLAAALGMGLGGLLFAMASLLGLHGVLLAVPDLYWALKIMGGIYLVYLATRIWRGAQAPLLLDEPNGISTNTPISRSFLLGLITQLSNPKTAIVYASVFAAFLPHTMSLGLQCLIASLVFMVEAGWYSVVALLLSSAQPRQIYLRFKAQIDRTAAGIMFLLGVKLVCSANKLA